MHRRRTLFVTLLALALAAFTVPAFAANGSSSITFQVTDPLTLTVANPLKANNQSFMFGHLNSMIYTGPSDPQNPDCLIKVEAPSSLYENTVTLQAQVTNASLGYWSYAASTSPGTDEISVMYSVGQASRTPTGQTVAETAIPGPTASTPVTLFQHASPGCYGGTLAIPVGMPSSANTSIGEDLSLTITWYVIWEGF